MNLHVLRGGMYAPRGHCIALVNAMSIALELSWLPEELQYLILTNSSLPRSKAYLVSRHAVQRTTEGLLYGEPRGGIPSDPEASYFPWPAEAQMPWWRRGDDGVPWDSAHHVEAGCMQPLSHGQPWLSHGLPEDGVPVRASSVRPQTLRRQRPRRR